MTHPCGLDCRRIEFQFSQEDHNGSTQQLSIPLPNDMADAVRAKFAAGEYATEGDVIRDGLRVLLARERAVEDWLRQDVAAACDALKADPSRAVEPNAIKARLATALRPQPASAGPNA